jgi:hypothetical protein
MDFSYEKSQNIGKVKKFKYIFGGVSFSILRLFNFNCPVSEQIQADIEWWAPFPLLLFVYSVTLLCPRLRVV